jgi:hypothetical protein
VGKLALAGRRARAQLRDRHHGAERIVRPPAQPHARGSRARGLPAWLGEEVPDEVQLKSLLAPYPSEGMTCWPVSSRVGNVKNNDPSLVDPVVLS